MFSLDSFNDINLLELLRVGVMTGEIGCKSRFEGREEVLRGVLLLRRPLLSFVSFYI